MSSRHFTKRGHFLQDTISELNNEISVYVRRGIFWKKNGGWKSFLCCPSLLRNFLEEFDKVLIEFPGVLHVAHVCGARDNVEF